MHNIMTDIAPGKFPGFDKFVIIANKEKQGTGAFEQHWRCFLQDLERKAIEVVLQYTTQTFTSM